MATYKLVDTDQLETDLKTVADAIREKGGTTEQLAFPDGMASAVEAIQAGGGDTRLKDYIEGTSTELYDADVTSVGEYKFYNSRLSTFNFPNVTKIGGNAFALSQITNLPLCPKVSTVGERAFYACKMLKNIVINGDVQFGGYAFIDCENVTSIIAEDLTQTSFSMFQGLKNVTSINLPKAKTIDENTFVNCSALKNIELPSLEGTLEYRVFSGCVLLESIDLGSGVNNLYKECARYCNSLKAFIIRATSGVCAAAAAPSSLFVNCYHLFGTVNSTYNPDGLKDGYVYVPRALIEDYKVATNWTTLADQFRALEDYTVDGTTTGEMDWDKINGGAS